MIKELFKKSINEFIDMVSFAKNKVDPSDFYADYNRSQFVTSDMNPTAQLSTFVSTIFDGEKFPGGFGDTLDFSYIDYYSLRKKSVQLFYENPYALGAVRRLISNEINTGLTLSANVISEILGMSEDESQNIAEEIETSWNLYCKNPIICDYKKERTLHKLAYIARMEALIEGDILAIQRINPQTSLPYIELIQGCYVKTPFDKQGVTNEINNGVELDSLGRQVAYWVESKSGTIERLPAYGIKTGRRLAWLIYGSDRRIGEVRGMPFISCMFYMLKELDRYRDSEQRAAFINSIIAGYVKKTKPVLSSLPMSGGSSRRGTTTNVNDDSTYKTTKHTNNLPGMYFEEMAEGEEPQSYNTQRPNVNFNAFQEAILNVFFYVNEIPPEIGMLQFKNNFSASRQADNEFKVYLKKADDMINGAQFYQPIYECYLYQAALTNLISAQSLVDAWGNYSQWLVYGAWVNAEWTGLSRPSVDILKDVNAMILATQNNFATADFACRRISNMSYKGVINQRKKEMKIAEKAGLNNLQPDIRSTGQETSPNDIIQARIKRIENKINLMDILSYDSIEKQEEIN